MLDYITDAEEDVVNEERQQVLVIPYLPLLVLTLSHVELGTAGAVECWGAQEI